jgi:glucosamine--fructose-6-phosphate aminotransferase (isomerizing)
MPRAATTAHVFKAIDNVLILACGTSYYSGCTAKYWLESIAKMPTQVEMASEYRYRESVPNPRTLVVTITQSGETADTLAALRHAQSQGMTHTLTICNVMPPAPWCANASWPTSPARGWRSAWPPPRPSPPSWRGCFC